jgi:hypothetical protein
MTIEVFREGSYVYMKVGNYVTLDLSQLELKELIEALQKFDEPQEPVKVVIH